MKLLCPECEEHILEVMCTIGADESNDEYSHTLLHCPECLRDWDLMIDSNGVIIDLKRKYWG